MKTTVKKWGNSLAVRLPKKLIEDTQVAEGCNLDIKTENGKIVLSPTIKKYSLKELINEINESNMHSEISTGDNVGGEIW
jgi:antitoxin MazE